MVLEVVVVVLKVVLQLLLLQLCVLWKLPFPLEEGGEKSSTASWGIDDTQVVPVRAIERPTCWDNYKSLPMLELWTARTRSG